ncbi:15482_t:CDS:2, partial [Acaulospora colombiana]
IPLSGCNLIPPRDRFPSPVSINTAPSTPKAGPILVSSVISEGKGVSLAVAVGKTETVVLVARTVENDVEILPLADTTLEMVETGTVVVIVVVAFCAATSRDNPAKTSATRKTRIGTSSERVQGSREFRGARPVTEEGVRHPAELVMRVKRVCGPAIFSLYIKLTLHRLCCHWFCGLHNSQVALSCALGGYCNGGCHRIHPWCRLLYDGWLKGKSYDAITFDRLTPWQEFYLYNIGFRALFPKYADKDFPVSQTMQIELGMIGAVTIMGMAVQARVLIALQAKLREINAEQERRNAEVEAKAAARFDAVNRELEDWEREHGKGGRNPNKDDLEASRTQTPESPRASSQFSLFKSSRTHAKRRSSITMADLANTNQNTPKEEPVTPKINLDLGESVEKAIPEDLKAAEGNIRLSEEEKKDTDLVQRVSLLNEIQGASSSKNLASSGTTQPKPGQRSPGRTGTRPLSQFDSFGVNSGLGIQEDRTQRPTSTPALTEWDNYVRSRNLFQPPSGVTAPITATPIQQPRPQSISVPLAVAEALEQRKKQEKAYELGGPDAYIEAAAGGSSGRQSRPSSVMLGNGNSEEDQPLSHRRRTSSHSLLQGSSRTRTNSQVLILPPQRSSPSPSPNQPIVRTFEELESRHKEKIKALQDPLTKKEKEEAEIAAARKRWERSVQVERNVMNRKEQEQVPDKREGHTRSSSRPHSRSLSAFALQGQDTSRPLSNINKVQEWKRYQDATQQQPTTEQSSSNSGHQRSRSKSPHGLLSGSHSSRPHSQSFGRTDAIV